MRLNHREMTDGDELGGWTVMVAIARIALTAMFLWAPLVGWSWWLKTLWSAGQPNAGIAESIKDLAWDVRQKKVHTYFYTSDVIRTDASTWVLVFLVGQMARSIVHRGISSDSPIWKIHCWCEFIQKASLMLVFFSDCFVTRSCRTGNLNGSDSSKRIFLILSDFLCESKESNRPAV
jgi:hypothetical protein